MKIFRLNALKNINNLILVLFYLLPARARITFVIRDNPDGAQCATDDLAPVLAIWSCVMTKCCSHGTNQYCHPSPTIHDAVCRVEVIVHTSLQTSLYLLNDCHPLDRCDQTHLVSG